MTQTIVIRIAVMWMVLLAIFAGQSGLANLLFGPDYTIPRHTVAALLCTLITVPAILWAHIGKDREPLSALGMALDRTALRPFLLGMLVWLAPFILGLAFCLGFGLVDLRMTAPLAETLTFLPLLLVLVFLLEALPEELAFRGYIQSNLARIVEPWLAVTLQAALFGSWGVALWLITAGGIDIAQASMFYVMGAILGMVRQITGSVWSCIGVHLAFQAVAQLLLHEQRGHIEIDGAIWLQIIALGAVPFSLTVPMIERFYPDKVDWTAKPG